MIKKEGNAMFYDIESDEYITIEQLFLEYQENRKSNPSEFKYSFSDYIRNCLTINGGTLESVQIKIK